MIEKISITIDYRFHSRRFSTPQDFSKILIHHFCHRKQSGPGLGFSRNNVAFPPYIPLQLLIYINRMMLHINIADSQPAKL